MNVTHCPSSQPAHQLANHDPTKSKESDRWPTLPDESMDKLVNLRIGHGPILLRISCQTRWALSAKVTQFSPANGREAETVPRVTTSKDYIVQSANARTR